MVDAPIPPDDAARLKALRGHNLLDTLPEPEYDAITRLAAQICGVPVSLISLVDEDRCWFKSNHGLDGPSEAPRSVAFAAHAIAAPGEPFVVEDALADERFADGPLALGDPPIRFYAGTPLVDDDGHALGTLCVIDHEPRRLDDGQLASLRALATQVTALLRLRREAAERAELQADLERVNADLSAFNYSVAHDLRAPLGIVGGLAEIVDEDYAALLDDDGREAVVRLRAAAARARDLVDALLDLSHAGAHALERRAVDLTALAREAFAGLGAPASAELAVADGLAAACDERLARLAITNLLDNAVKYSAGAERIRVEVGPSERGLYVRDNGIGFDAGSPAAETLFAPFTRLRTGGAFPGSGIGLAIVARVARRHGGRVTAESQPGAGATFAIDFGA